MTMWNRLACMVLLLLTATAALAQDAQPRALTPEAAQFNQWFEDAAAEFDVPVALLQAIAYTESRWRHLVPSVETLNETVHKAEAGAEGAGNDAHDLPHGQRVQLHQDGPPPAYGVMGLHDDAHFGFTIREAAALIGRTPDELKESAQLNIRGAAALLHKVSGGATRSTALEHWEDAVAIFSGIPQPGVAEMFTYDVFSAVLSGRATDQFRVRQQDVSLAAIYGGEKLKVLSAPRLTIDAGAALDSAGAFRAGTDSDDYAPAVWDPAATCNYGAGRSATVTHVAEHIAQGSYSGTISWFKNCSASVSAHYVVRSSDGQVTQMVRESNTAWHVASHNSYSIGIEHEGYAENCSWYTTAMYNGSSLLTRDIADSNGIARTATYDASLGWDTELDRYSAWKIKGHTNFPTTKTCPGVCFDWPRFRSLVIGYSRTVDNTDTTRFAASGNWAVSSFSTLRYGADYRYANPAAISDSAWYKFDIPATGNYEVYVWYPSNSGYNNSTPFVIVASGGNRTVNVDQRVNGGLWVSLGIHPLDGGDANKVGISRWTNGTGYVIADAVRIVAR